MPTVLMIDDSKTVVAAVSVYMSQHGYTVASVQNFVEIPRAIESLNPLAIILDLNMPALSGEQIGKFLQRQKYGGKVIIYSGESKEKLAHASATLGAYCHVSKMQPIGDLLEALKRATGQIVSAKIA